MACNGRIPKPEDYHISYEYGFLLPDALTELPEYFAPWNKLVKDLPCHLEHQSLRDQVNRLALLDYRKLRGHREYRCGHLFLSMLAAGYVWQEGDSGVVHVLPRQLAEPLHGVARHLGLPPIILHASAVLANCPLIHSDSNLGCTVALFPKEASDWFFAVTGLVELAFVPGLKSIMSGLHAVAAGDTDAVCESLISLAESLEQMYSAVTRLHDKLPGRTFHKNIRPYLAGYGGSLPLPDGLILEGVSPQPVKLTGGSAAQSSTIHCIDAALGIKHKKDRQEFLDSMLDYMPPAHAQFIVALRNAPSIRTFVLCRQDGRLQRAYDKAVDSLENFRSYHLQIVSKYIIQQSASANTDNHRSLADKGTGGTSIMPFLKDLRDTTKHARMSAGN